MASSDVPLVSSATSERPDARHNLECTRRMARQALPSPLPLLLIQPSPSPPHCSSSAPGSSAPCGRFGRGAGRSIRLS